MMQAKSAHTVLLVSHTSFMGGAERSMAELAKALLTRGDFRPVIVCPASGELSRRAAAGGITVLPYDAPRVEAQSPLALAAQGLCAAEAVWTLRRHVAQVGACLVHANGVKAFAVGVAAARWAGIPCVFHARDYPRHPRLLRSLVGKAAATVAPSTFLAQALRQTLDYPNLNVAVVPNPVAPLPGGMEAGKRFRMEWAITPGARLIAMIAQTVPWKRHDLFLEAAAMLRTARRDLHFVVAGSDPWGADASYAAKLTARAARPDLKGCITFVGQRDDIGALLAATDVLVLPSDAEPFGRVIVEAWWAGVPVVVSDHGGPAELVRHGHTGLHFLRGNAAALAVAVRRLLTDAALSRKVATNGRAEAARFAPELHAEAIENLYKSLVRRESTTDKY